MTAEQARERVNGVIRLLDGLTVKEANQVLDSVRRQTQEAIIRPLEDGMNLAVPPQRDSFITSLEALVERHTKGSPASI
ncbi:MAG: hypothetical protein AB7E48_00415 [Deferribacterales bacterium]